MKAGINLAEAALQVAAEDDALVSHSTVPLPIHAFLQRITRLAKDVNSAAIQKLPADVSPEEVLQVRPLLLRIVCHSLGNWQCWCKFLFDCHLPLLINIAYVAKVKES